ncbi:outer dense fiber protein 3-like isoform X1 [Haliotis rufescens]|uniref:outer dense fiber protein 3-like isoform X1 n=2 Tax=Haliotis rufescens TaxID=6454 RepID=UPI001EAF9B79|nr:outer dense fiber protein 3-like isoform X1 [Haliotis rufescens]
MSSVTSTPRDGVMAETAYSLPSTLGIERHDPRMRRAPAYSFGSRYLQFKDDSPGPAYNVDSRVTKYGREREKGVTMAGRPSPRPVANISPGPIYRTDSLGSPRNKRAPCYSFGRRSFPNFDGANPGPTTYNIPSTLGSDVTRYRGSRAVALRGRDQFGFSYDWSKTPGPAAYGAPTPMTKRAPVVTMKGRNYLPSYKQQNPGPGAYDTDKLFYGKQASPRFTIGIKHSDKALPYYTLADVGE